MNRKWLFWIPVLLWMGLIFYSSAQPYKKQDMRSDIEQYVNVEFYFEETKLTSLGSIITAGLNIILNY